MDTMKRSILQTIGEEEGEGKEERKREGEEEKNEGKKKEEKKKNQVKSMENIFNEIIEENIFNLKKEIPIKLQETHKMPNKLTRKETTHGR